jgi:hypothetical protein
VNIATQPGSLVGEKIGGELLARFAQIVGERYAITEPVMQEPYLREMRDLYHGHTPMVLRPGSVAEVSAILKLANETKTPIVPQGGNTGLVGGQIPHHGEIVLSLNRMDKIREIDAISNTITAEAGEINPETFPAWAHIQYVFGERGELQNRGDDLHRAHVLDAGQVDHGGDPEAHEHEQHRRTPRVLQRTRLGAEPCSLAVGWHRRVASRIASRGRVRVGMMWSYGVWVTRR